jgi:hypothetical protein
MRSRFCYLILAALFGALVLAGCGVNPAAQAEPAPAPAAAPILHTPPPMPTSPPRPPTPTPPPPPAARAPAAAATLLSADFGPATDLTQWTVRDAADALPGPSIWQTLNGHLVPASDANTLPALYASALVTGDPLWQDYQVSTAAYVSANDEVGLVARANAQGYYVFKLLPQGRTPALILARYEEPNHTFVPLATVATGGYVERRWYQLALAVHGAQLTAYVDGQAVLSAHDTTYARGQAGVTGYPEGGLEFDNFAVQALAASSQP